MKFKILFLITSLLFTSCGTTNNDILNFRVSKNKVINLTNYQFKNLNSLDTYYIDNSPIPYVAVEDFFYCFNGFFLTDSLSIKETKKSTNLQIKDTFYEIVFDFADDKIFLNSTASDSYYLDFTNLNANSSFNPVVDYNLIYKATGKQTLPKNKELDLAKYNLKIETIKRNNKRKTLIPFHVLDTIFCTTSKYMTIYLNDDVYYINEGPFIDGSSNAFSIRNSALNSKTQTDEFRNYTYNHMLFALDYYYGLKNYRNVDSYSSFIDKEIKDLILSNNAIENCRGYSKLAYGTLGEMHTGILGTSFYAPLNKSINKDYVSKSDFNSNVRYYYESKAIYEKLFNESANWPSMNTDPVLIKDDLAIISLDNFSINSKEHNIQGIPKRYEAYNIMQYALNKIEENKNVKNKNVKNIILDLSRNGGGLVVSMYLTLSFLTNDPLEYVYVDSFKENTTTFRYTFDTNQDKNFNDNDSFDKYNWNILISPLSFSAGNLLPFIAKENNYATILGQRSGGGMCTVNYLALADGTSLQISSTQELRVRDKTNKLHKVEQGCNPNIKVDYNDFYNVDYYLNLLK